MGLTSLQACMDSDWLQEAESSGGSMLDSTTTSPSAADILAACSTRPQASAMAVAATAMMDGGRRLRPPHDHPQKCPRCESTHTKFCYYNNYSLSQPRYFCKTCRRYWTKGGTLRNIPVGGGCRKNKKPSSSNSPSSKKPSNIVTTDLMALAHSHQNYQNASLGFPHFGGNGMMGSYTAPDHSNVGYLESKYGGLLSQSPRPIDFLDSKFDLMGVNNNNLVMVDHGSNGDHHHNLHNNVGGLFPFGVFLHDIAYKHFCNVRLDYNQIHLIDLGSITMADNKTKTSLFDFFLLSVFLVCLCLAPVPASAQGRKLSFGVNGQFKILQVADMHYANGGTTRCQNVLPSQMAHCSDLNTTAFMSRVIAAEKPDLIVFTGDNIFGSNVKDAVKSMNAAFAPAIAAKIPWVAVLGNHDQESTLSRQELMKHIVKLPNTLSKVNPPEAAHYIDGFGNNNLQIHGAVESSLHNKSVLNLYFLDSGDYSSITSLSKKYDWIKTSQQFWFDQTSKRLQKEYNKEPNPQQGTAPGLAYFHIPFPEFWSFDSKNASKGVRQEETGSATTNSGFFTTLVDRGDVKSVFVGHDHLNDFCGELKGLNLCYGGGFGYHAYGKAGWERRARVVVADLNKKGTGSWGDVKSIRTWKRLDDQHLSVIDEQVLWTSSPK